MRHLAICLVVSMSLSACNGAAVTTSPATGGHVHPYVVQNNQPPVNWVQFTPNTSGREHLGIVAGPNRQMWFTDYSSNGVAHISMTGHVTEFTLPANTAPYNLTIGADGNAYVEGSTSDTIDRVTTTGTVTAYPLPSNDIPTGHMVLGPDGNVWFQTSSHIAKITTAGEITEYPYPSGATFQYDGGVDVGPDGAIWFVESKAGIIGKIDPTTSAITEYPTSGSPIGSCYATGLATAKNGSLYFACAPNQNSSTGYVGKITTAGAQSYYANPYGFSMTSQDVALGPDKQIWISPYAFGTPQVAEFNVKTHVITTHAAPDALHMLNYLTAGPDGNVWGTLPSGQINVYVLNVLDVEPNTLSFNGTGGSQTLTVTETGATSWSASSSKPSVATVQPGGSADQFVVTAAGTGTCTVTVSDGKGNTFGVKVTVS